MMDSLPKNLEGQPLGSLTFLNVTYQTSDVNMGV